MQLIADGGASCYARRMVADGLEGVFLTHRAALERFARARCGAADADDILQDLWIKLAGVHAPPADPLSYLYRMTDNLIIDRHRSTRRRERRDDAWSVAANGDGASGSSTPSVEQTAIAKSDLARVAALFDELGEPTTGIFRRYRIEGEPQRDIASDYGLSLSAIEKHLQKAYKAVMQLRAVLDAENGDADRLNGERTE